MGHSRARSRPVGSAGNRSPAVFCVGVPSQRARTSPRLRPTSPHEKGSVVSREIARTAPDGTSQLAIAAAIILDDRVLLCGHTTPDFDQEWDLPRRPGAARRDPRQCPGPHPGLRLRAGHHPDTRYLGSHNHIHHGQTIRTFVFTATCADPLQICQHVQVAHCWADSASLQDQISQDLARLTNLAMQATAGWTEVPPRQWQITTALRASSEEMRCRKQPAS
jgi:hypothetical protein